DRPAPRADARGRGGAARHHVQRRVRPLERARPEAQLGKAPEASVVRGGVLAPELEQDLDGLLRHLGRLVEAEAKLGELARAHALADAEIEPPAREVV